MRERKEREREKRRRKERKKERRESDDKIAVYYRYLITRYRTALIDAYRPGDAWTRRKADERGNGCISWEEK
jgi:hypothetical protein